MSEVLVQSGDHLLLRVRAAPGASRSGIAGVLGERLKVRIAQPPEGGRANDAIIELLAETLRVPARDVSIASGHASRDKSFRIAGLDPSTARTRLGLP